MTLFCPSTYFRSFKRTPLPPSSFPQLDPTLSLTFLNFSPIKIVSSTWYGPIYLLWGDRLHTQFLAQKRTCQRKDPILDFFFINSKQHSDQLPTCICLHFCYDLSRAESCTIQLWLKVNCRLKVYCKKWICLAGRHLGGTRKLTIPFMSTVYFHSQLTCIWFGPKRKFVKYHGMLRENGY